MTELERRALLGDKQAQDECTEKGILLPCPFCGSKKSSSRYACGAYFVECLNCHGTSSVTSTKESVFRDWNTRPAPPIGRCLNCKQLSAEKNECEEWTFCKMWRRDVDLMDYCSYFEPKGGE